MLRSLSAESPVHDQRRRWERKRGRTARELLETERAYVEELELITKFYDEVFRVRCGSLKLAQEGICGTIPSIVKVNRSLLMCLERNMASSGFQNFSQYLHLYKKHADCIEGTRHAVQVQVKKKKSFARFMKLQENRPEFQGRTLEQLLELPLHRVMRYKHYLLDLVENTFPGSPDSVQLNGALQVVTDVCDHIDNMQQLQENDRQLQRVQKLLKGRRIRILSPGRRFIREGWLSLVPPSGEDVKHHMLFLFSDVLLVTAPCHPLHPFNAHKFCCRAVYPLRECHVEKVLGHTQSQGGLISVRSPHVDVAEMDAAVSSLWCAASVDSNNMDDFALYQVERYFSPVRDIDVHERGLRPPHGNSTVAAAVCIIQCHIGPMEELRCIHRKNCILPNVRSAPSVPPGPAHNHALCLLTPSLLVTILKCLVWLWM